MKRHNKDTGMQNDKLRQLENMLQVPESPSADEVWSRLEEKIDRDVQPAPSRPLSLSPRVWAVAAALALLLATGAILRFASVTVYCPPGHTRQVILPDNSVALLNADSKLSYKRFWWPVSRQLTLTGEAWFKVTKGKKFTVRSPQGSTTVLGTRFNIFARDNTYKVACISGKVQVKARKTKKSIVLNPAEEAAVTPEGNIIYHKNIDLEPVVAWKNGVFIFTGTPLADVIKEIERRYNVHIKAETDLNRSYTGSFPDTIELKKAMELICKPFGLKFAVDNSGNITIHN